MKAKKKLTVSIDKLRGAKKNKSGILTIRIEEGLLQAFKKVCEKDLGGMNVSLAMRRLMAQVCDKYNRKY
jgi:hypothetical protein